MSKSYKERRKEIKNMLKKSGRTNLDTKKLAEKYDISRKMIYNDFDAIKEEVQDVDSGDVYFTSKMILEMVKDKLRIMQQDKKQVECPNCGNKFKENIPDTVNLGAAKALLKAIEKEFEFAERMGVIDKPAEKIEVKNNYSEKLRDVYSDMREMAEEDDGESE